MKPCNDCCYTCKFSHYDYYFIKDAKKSLICLRDDMVRAKKVKENDICQYFKRFQGYGLCNK